MIYYFNKAIGFLACGSLLLALLFSTDRVRAQSSDASDPENDEEYKDIVSQAVGEYESQHWAKAIELFQKAHAIKPNARTLRGMGLAAFEESRYMDSVQWLTEALEHKEKPLTREMRADVKPVIARAREFVGFFELSNELANVTIEIDGHPAVIDKGTVKVDVGERHLVAKADGYETLEKTLHVISGDNGVLGIELEPSRATKSATRTGTKSADDDGAKTAVSETSNSTAVPWVIIGAGSAAAVAGGVFIGLYVKDRNVVNNSGYLPNIKTARDRLPLYSSLGFALAGVGVAAVVFGTVMMLSNDKPINENANSAVFEFRAGLDRLSVAGHF
jgi:hypothetical protein